MITILFDGWCISYSPNSPAALHLLTLLEACPAEVEPMVLLPAPAPEWFPDDVTTRLQITPKTSAARLFWEQRTLPRIARQVGVQLAHLTTATPALTAPIPTLISPCGYGITHLGENEIANPGDTAGIYAPVQSWGVAERLRRSLAEGAMDRVAAILWPDDLPYPSDRRQPSCWQKMPPTVHPAFLTQQSRPVNHHLDNLPETYFLYQGPFTQNALHVLLQAWSWAAGPIGETCPLVLVGMDEVQNQWVSQLIAAYALEVSVQRLPALSPQELAGLYQGCSGLFHPAPLSPWEGPVRQALVSGKPVVAAKSKLADALVGPAAYLIDKQDTRAMGAALIAIMVESNIATDLSRAARERSFNWNQPLFREKLRMIYHTVKD